MTHDDTYRRECARLRNPVTITLREARSTDPEVPISEYARMNPECHVETMVAQIASLCR